MHWEDEDYVRVYVRDTPKWIRLGWEAQSVFMHLMRKLDRDGYLELGEQIETDLADYLRIPVDVVRRALPVLLQSQCVVLNGVRLFVPHFVEAQEARRSAAARKREERRREKAQKLSQTLESSHTPSQSVARESHEVTRPSHNVTLIPDPIPIPIPMPVLCAGACPRDLKTPPPPGLPINEELPENASLQNNPHSARLTAVTEPKRTEAKVAPSEPRAPPPNASNGRDPALSRILENLRKYPQLAKVATEEFAVHVVDKTLGTNVNEAILDKVLEEFAYKHEPSDNLDSLKRQLGGFLLSAHRNPKKYLDLIRAEPLRKAGPVPIERYVPVPEPEDGIVLTKEIWDDLLKTMDNGMNPRSRKRAGNELRPTGGGREQARGPARA